MVWELKNDLVDANPKQLSSDELDREFHRIYLQTGCMPVASLRERRLGTVPIQHSNQGRNRTQFGLKVKRRIARVDSSIR
jgi:hypothetical protein